MPDFFPSAKVTLRIRFDESAGRPSLPLPTDFPTGRRAPDRVSPEDVLAAAQVLQLVEDPATGSIVLRSGLGPGVRQTVAEGEASADGLTQVVGIIPKAVSIEYNGIRMADTFKVTLPYVDAPFDPRLIRACGVEIFVGVVNAEEFEGGMVRRQRREFAAGEPLSLVPDIDTRTGRSNRRLIGFVDGWETLWSEDGQSELQMEGRDLTSLLIDANMPPGLRANLRLPLTRAIAQVMATLPAAEGMSVEMRPANVIPPVLDFGQPRHTRPRRQTRGGRRQAQGDTQKVSYWDYITDLAGAAGLITFVEDTTVVLQSPRSVYGTEFTRRQGDPFQGRVTPGAQPEFSPNRRMIYGRNITTLKADRKFTLKKVNTVQVRCYDTQTKKTLIENFPNDPRLTDVPPGQNGGDERVDVYRVSACRDRATLRRIAQSIYEQQGRNEISFAIETRDLASSGGDNSDPDLLDLRAGDNLEVLVATDGGSTLTTIQSLDPAARAGFLEGLGFGREFAAAYARAFETQAHFPVFRTRDSRMEWNQSDGYKMEIGCINYVTVREEALLPTGEEPTPPADPTAAPRLSDSIERPDRVRTTVDPDVSPFPAGLE